jgi:hypothetical protein
MTNAGGRSNQKRQSNSTARLDVSAQGTQQPARTDGNQRVQISSRTGVSQLDQHHATAEVFFALCVGHFVGLLPAPRSDTAAMCDEGVVLHRLDRLAGWLAHGGTLPIPAACVKRGADRLAPPLRSDETRLSELRKASAFSRTQLRALTASTAFRGSGRPGGRWRPLPCGLSPGGRRGAPCRGRVRRRLRRWN